MEVFKEKAIRDHDLVKFTEQQLGILVSEPHKLCSTHFSFELGIKRHVVSQTFNTLVITVSYYDFVLSLLLFSE